MYTILASPVQKGYNRRYVDLYISMIVSILDCPHYLDIPWMRRWVSFYGPLWFETEFWQHLSSVLQIHTVPARSSIERIAGGAAEILSQIGVEHEN